MQADAVSYDNLAVTYNKVYDLDALQDRIKQIFGNIDDESLGPPLDANFIRELKFSECLPQNFIDLEVVQRYACEHQLQHMKKLAPKLLHISQKKK